MLTKQVEQGSDIKVKNSILKIEDETTLLRSRGCNNLRKNKVKSWKGKKINTGTKEIISPRSVL